jgi:uncharacterized protein with FMN-binding domain
MAPRNSHSKVANKLVLASSAAVLAVYAAGYTKTESAAKKLEERTSDRMPARPVWHAPVDAAPVVVAKAEDASISVTENNSPAKPVTTEKPKAVPVEIAKVISPKLLNPAAPLPAPTASNPATPEAAAPTPAAIAPPIAPVVPAVLKDGKYSGWGTCRHGDIQATVTVEAGKITSAVISDCQTRYSCDVIDRLPPQVVARQSPDVDRVSGATQSADAFYWAVVQALKQAQ